MRADVESLLQAAADVREADIVLRNVCAAYGEVVRTGVMCSTENGPPDQITGIVEMKEKIALSIADHLGVGNVGTRLVIFRYRPPQGFQAEEGSGV